MLNALMARVVMFYRQREARLQFACDQLEGAELEPTLMNWEKRVFGVSKPSHRYECSV